MADPIEQKIVAAIVARMLTINGSGSFQTSIGVRTEDSRTNWDQKDDLPATSVFQGEVTSEEVDNEGIRVVRTLPVMVQGFFERLATPALTAAYARKAIGDYMRAIRSDDKWIVSSVPLALGTREKAHRIVYTEGTYEIDGVQLEIEIGYLANKFDMES